MPNLIDSYSSTYRDTDVLFTDTVSNGKDAIGQAFTITRPCSITSVKFYLKKTNSPSGSFVAKIYACTGTPGSAGKPTGAALGTSGAVSTTALSASQSLVEFTFSTPVPLGVGNYCAVMEINTETSFDNSNYVDFGCDASSPTHAGNLCQADDIGTWEAVAGQDACFELYGNYRSSILMVV